MKHQAWLCVSLFVCVYCLRMFLCCHDNFSLDGTKPIAALGNLLKFLAFHCNTNPMQSNRPFWWLSPVAFWYVYQNSMWPDHHQRIIRLAQSYTTGSAYHYSLDDPSRWRVKVRVAVTNTAVTSPPSTLLANWPSKTLNTKHGQLGSTGARANRRCL